MNHSTRSSATPILSATLRSWSFVGCLAFLLFLLAGTETLPAQENGLENGISVHGPEFPAELEGLEQAYVDFLHALNGGDAGEVFNHFAQDMSILTRGGVEKEYSGLQDILSLVVPHLRIRETQIHLLDLTDGWASIGEMLHFTDTRTDAEGTDLPQFGPTMTIWERGPDLRWRVVFLSAPWIGSKTWEILADRMGGLNPEVMPPLVTPSSPVQP